MSTLLDIIDQEAMKDPEESWMCFYFSERDVADMERIFRDQVVEEIAQAVQANDDGTVVQGFRTAQFIRTLKTGEAA